jgi:hypothetical protein
MKVSGLSERSLMEGIADSLSKPHNNAIVDAGEDDCIVLEIGVRNIL